MATPVPASPLLPVADVHVVMNAFNRLAARSLALGGEEDPLLFALADYLRATLAGSSSLRVPLGQETQALVALLALEEQTADARLGFSIEGELPAASVPRGLLLAAAGALLRARRPRSGGHWAVILRCTGRGTARGLEMVLRARAPGSDWDADAARAQLQLLVQSAGPAAEGIALVGAGRGEGIGLRIPLPGEAASRP